MKAIKFLSGAMLLTLCTSLLILTPVDALEQRGVREVKERLYALREAGKDKYELTHTPTIDWLVSGKDRAKGYDFKLNKGEDYLIVGVCDSDCRDMDLELYNGNVLLDFDREPGSTPYLEFVPQQTGYYSLGVTIPSCTTGQCTFGIGILTKTGVPEISTKTLAKVINSKANYTLIDSRKKSEFNNGHISTARSIPYTDMTKNGYYLLPDHKDELLIFYCWNEACEWSEEAAKIAIEYGYTRVYRYSAGYVGWLNDGYKPCDCANDS